MATQFQKAVKGAVTETTKCLPDAVICKRDGTVEVKRGYFYRMGMTAEKWGEKVAEAVAAVPGARVVETLDKFAFWPKTSYFVAVVAER